MDHVQAGERLARPRLARAPLAGVAAALIVGIVAGRYLPLPAAGWATLGAAAFIAAAVTFRRVHPHLITTTSVLACVFAIGAAYVRLALSSVADDDIATYTSRRPMLATVRGRIVTSPQVYDPAGSLKFGYAGGARTSFVLAAAQINTSDGWRKVSGLARVAVRQIDDRLAAGQDVELVCWLARPRGPSNPGQFDRAAAARRTRVLTSITVPAADGVTMLGAPGRPWHSKLFWNLRAAARQHLADCGDKETGSLMNALLIGERHPALRDINRQMVRTGTAHFLSISGLHLGVFLGFVYLLCRLFALAPRRSAGVVLIVLAAYMLLAQPRAPLLRYPSHTAGVLAQIQASGIAK